MSICRQDNKTCLIMRITTAYIYLRNIPTKAHNLVNAIVACLVDNIIPIRNEQLVSASGTTQGGFSGHFFIFLKLSFFPLLLYM